jgi:hypothetical protein
LSAIFLSKKAQYFRGFPDYQQYIPDSLAKSKAFYSITEAL